MRKALHIHLLLEPCLVESSTLGVRTAVLLSGSKEIGSLLETVSFEFPTIRRWTVKSTPDLL